ncbi:hypothetical protein BDV97DRAFT_286787 [Delphinella strobiligena]|nr:hypothetical protein BDV97DRAFT_286787 [Delphinella strobiligena]
MDQTEHEQNVPSDADRRHERQEYGGQGGPTGDSSHQNKRGAAEDYVKHATGQHEEPTFTGDPTVSAAETQAPVLRQRQDGVEGVGEGPHLANPSEGLQVLVGPLLNYRRMSGEMTDGPMWHGSVLVVAKSGQKAPALQIRNADGGDAISSNRIEGEKLYEDPKAVFWRFEIQVPFLPQESKWEYHIPGMEYVDSSKTLSTGPKIFSIPSKYASMRIMFHSCNGFSVGTDTDAWSGCALWNDVLRQHEQMPFHVMIGGGDQIYNDGVRVDGPLRPWTDISSPVKRRAFPFNEELRAKCDEYYFENYVRWYGIEPFSFANCQIPQLNIWDDHDIIDGFGSYTDHFMRCSVFRGIGGVAHKYYLLFQHHLPPPRSTYTTDAPQTEHANEYGTSGDDAVQLKDSFVMTPTSEDPSYIIGKTPGPYVEERSRSIYCQLGARIAFIGVDARTERTRHQINYPETYDQIFSRANSELKSNPNIKHLILLLGVPIAYPRLQWLENILQSPIIGPIRFLNKRFGIAGNFFNQFDGNVDLLDDLDDHYTAHQHKKERKELIQRLQKLAKKHSIRVSILGGDVHLCALGRFYSNPKLGIPIERDWRYMPNIISSAITNKPPPAAVANLLAGRNKIHHLDTETDETLLNIFDQDPGKGEKGVASKTQDKNHCTMPSRNYAIIYESHDLAADPALTRNGTGTSARNVGNPRNALHEGEENAGTKHLAADGRTRTGLGGDHGLDVTFRVEISPSDREGRTDGYGFTIPALQTSGYKP